MEALTEETWTDEDDEHAGFSHRVARLPPDTLIHSRPATLWLR